jgi:hypothetical protein
MSGRTNAVARFFQHVDKNGPIHPKLGSRCWLWIGYVRPNGYGRFMVAAGQPEYAHRFAYEITKGPIPEGKKLDHLCENRPCVNPAHTEPVTQLVNLHRSPRTLTSRHAARTHCNYGHTRWSTKGRWRRCLECKSVRHRADKAGISFYQQLEVEQQWQAKKRSA